MATILFSDRTGSVTRHADFVSRHVYTRHVDVWCPPGYADQPDRRYPVLYMHDGQNLFDPAFALGGIDWGMHETTARLIREKRIPAPIVVGVWNTPLRWREYMPQKALELPAAGAVLPRFLELAGGPPISDRYLKFLVEELKPVIDATYRTLPDQQHTFIMGSSMGGLISLYAALEYPQVFGGVGCISGHWPVGEDCLVQYIKGALPKPGSHRFYFDYGTETLDAGYEPYQLQVDDLLKAAGYRYGIDWLTLKFAGADHSESAWRTRVDIPLAFLLG